MSETKRPWGKRPRDERNFVRFSELSADQKMQRRREERQDKKERERTMAYFRSVHDMLAEVGSGEGDATALAGVVDSFFVELARLLREDPTLHLLRNGFVCRTIEAALASSRLLQSKALLYSLLGRLRDLVTSPVASYLLETLFASLVLAVAALGEDAEQQALELTDGGAGIHDGSGVPSTATVVQAAAEELAEAAGELLSHEVGARALRSIVLVLGGLPIRGAPPAPHPVRLDTALGTLASSIVTAVEQQGAAAGEAENAGKAAAEAWLAAAQEPTASFVLQSLLRVCLPGTPVDALVRQRLEGLELKRRSLLEHLLTDDSGCFVFQAYIRAPCPPAVRIAGDNKAMREDAEAAAALATSGSPSASKGAGQRRRAQKKALLDSDDDEERAAAEMGEEELLEGCCWGRALVLVSRRVGQLLSPGSAHVELAAHVLHTLALYAPTAAHLRLFWQRVVQPHLAQYLQEPTLGPVLAVFARRCAFERSAPEQAEGQTSGAAAVPTDINRTLLKEEAAQVRLFATSETLQREVCAAVCEATKATCSKGPAQFLCVERRMGDTGLELARHLLHMRPHATPLLQNAFDKVRLEDVLALAQCRRGSLVLQQWLRAAAARHSSSNGGGGSSSPAGGERRASPALRFFRRVQQRVAAMVTNRYAAYVVEVLYEVADLETKEMLVRELATPYEQLKSSGALPTLEGDNGAAAAADSEAAAGVQRMGGGEDDGEEEAEGRQSREMLQRHVVAQVLKKCYVEQYVHRPEDWRKLATRQCQVQQLLWRLLLNA